MAAPQHPPAEPMRVLDPAEIDHLSMYYLLNSVVVPRPIAWVSSVDEQGRTNLAPHSYMTIAAVSPPTVLFVSVGEKDTVRNIRATGNFVVHSVDRNMVEQMNVTAVRAPQGVSEIDLAHLTPIAADKVAAPRVAEAPVAMECSLSQIIKVGSQPSYVVFGEIVAMHIAERLFDDQGRVDPGRLDAVARMGGATYSTTSERFDLKRPNWGEPMDGGPWKFEYDLTAKE